MNGNDDDTEPSLDSMRLHLEKLIKLYDEKLEEITRTQGQYKKLVDEMEVQKCNLASPVTCQDILVKTANEMSDLSYSND